MVGRHRVRRRCARGGEEDWIPEKQMTVSVSPRLHSTLYLTHFIVRYSTESIVRVLAELEGHLQLLIVVLASFFILFQ